MGYEYRADSLEKTKNLAVSLAKSLRPGDVITLEGELGTGKTTFTKSLASGLGVEATVSSPTFTIIKQYEGRLPLYHMDVYRLEHEEEDLGFEEYFQGGGVTVVEWAQFIADFLPDEFLNISIAYEDESSRTYSFTPRGKHYEELVDQLMWEMKENA
ncbi:tRNA (adenosine(37)-N6)-threonylcarbamoyltransferase complex ATPase subunit type 1 TsaE [Virgibacillus halophilus]|uniref:tRNA threonylcarbamoyladenosine biosynthesis protein TsaE n=1 Tax=Tigheibacillus halophilus TaxID=361280 RepID=A0ABU5C838_9BACI|nr:tRNA (adenosine(37)-N6)-threonylcarbamoyltransferase complex ATPase subunit type 1 TsaE [Virgibacillus halophilus]